MSSEEMNYDSIMSARSEAIRASIEEISVAEVEAIGARLFPSADHPWREVLFAFLAENKGAAFYHATTNDGVQVIYCPSKNKGLWYAAQGGVGPLGEKGLQALSVIMLGR